MGIGSLGKNSLGEKITSGACSIPHGLAADIFTKLRHKEVTYNFALP